MSLTSLYSSATFLPALAVFFAAIVLALMVFWLLLKLYNFIRMLKQPIAYLELTPPAHTDRLPEATHQLFAALHGLGSSRRWYDRLLRYRNSISMEISSSRQDGIRFIVCVSNNHIETLEQAITAYMPDVKVKRASDYLGKYVHTGRIIEFKQKGHFAYPLQSHETLEQHDPIGYITSAMTKLSAGELIALQFVISPVQIREAESLNRKILNNEDLLPGLNGKRGYGSALSNAINKVLFGLVDAIGSGYHGTSKSQYLSAQKDLDYQKQIAKRLKPVRTLSYFEHELVESIHNKVRQPLFKADIRVLFSCNNKQEFRKRKRSFESAISLFSIPKYQSLKASTVRYGWLKRYQFFAFSKRLPTIFYSKNVLAASELASLYHFPNTLSAKTENIVKSLSRTLPAPVSLKRGGSLDVLLGENQHHGSITPIGLTVAERERHVYIIGGTGNGKTTMLLYGIVQDIQNGKGVTVLDPHGDLAETILRHIPEERIRDVVYLNPDDLARPIGINLLELTPGLAGDDLLREKDLITESTISVLRKIFSEDDSGGHRIEYILRNTIQTALTIEGATLFTIFHLLNDTKYRRMIVKTLQDQDLKNFWNNELGKAGEFQKVKMSAGITSKIGRFLFSASAKRILEQEKSTIDFEDILNSGKILICNFSKGLLGEDTSTLFGTTVLAKLQVAALRRARIKQTNRRPYHLYVDEFQNFATMSFVQMLSEARKYKLYLTMAEQSTSQQDEQRLVDIILANVGTVICFRSGSPADERLILPLFIPYIEPGEIANLPAYNFYARIAAINAQEPMSGNTVLLKNRGSEDIAMSVTEQSRIKYGVAKAAKTQTALDVKDPKPNMIKQRKSRKAKSSDTAKIKNPLPIT